MTRPIARPWLPADDDMLPSLALRGMQPRSAVLHNRNSTGLRKNSFVHRLRPAASIANIMQFTAATISSVKSISQLALCRYWAEIAGNLQFASLETFQPTARLHDPKQLVVWNVERHAGTPTFRAVYQGRSVGEVFNEQWAGMSMEDIAPPPLRKFSIDAAHECAVSGDAVYTILSTADANGHQVDCERLLLPLGHNGLVRQIVASLQLISLKGTFERKSVLSNFKERSVVTFAARISARKASARKMTAPAQHDDLAG